MTTATKVTIEKYTNNLSTDWSVKCEFSFENNNSQRNQRQHLLEQKQNTHIKSVTRDCKQHQLSKNMLPMQPMNKRFSSDKLWQEYVLCKYYRYFGLSMDDVPVEEQQNQINDNNIICHKNREVNERELTPEEVKICLDIYRTNSSNKKYQTKESKSLEPLRPLNKRFTSPKLWQDYVLEKHYRYFGLNNESNHLRQNEINGVNKSSVVLTSNKHQIPPLNPLNKRFANTKEWSEYVQKHYYVYFTGHQQQECLPE